MDRYGNTEYRETQHMASHINSGFTIHHCSLQLVTLASGRSPRTTQSNPKPPRSIPRTTKNRPKANPGDANERTPTSPTGAPSGW